MAINIPTIPPSWPSVERDYPISPKENLMLALNHQKPKWMPNIYSDSQMLISKAMREKAPNALSHEYDWFGTHYVFSSIESSSTPEPGMFDEISEWRDNVQWPDLDAIDWAADAKDFKRDENKALFVRFSNGPFERLHMFEGFEQALIDMFVEPEECRAFYERLADYKISLFNHLKDHYPLDYIVVADDWGSEKAPFFSNELLEKTLLEPHKRMVQAVHDRGVKYIAHCCGKINAFIPYFVNEMKVDGLEIQGINDIPNILKNYGDKVMIEYKADPNLVHNDEATDAQLTSHIRDIVDRFGAASNPGSGVVMNLQSSFEHSFYTMEEELYRYSLEKYKPL